MFEELRNPNYKLQIKVIMSNIRHSKFKLKFRISALKSEIRPSDLNFDIRPSDFGLKKVLFGAFAIILSLAIGYQTSTNTTSLIAIFIGLFLILATIKKPLFAIYIILFLPLLGELVRLPFGPENGLLISDVFVGILLTIWIAKKIFNKQPLPKSSLTKPLLIFILIAILSLLQALLFLKAGEIAASSLYLIRLIEYAFLFLIVKDIIAQNNNLNAKNIGKKILAVSIFSSFLIAIVGFIQLYIYPNLTKLEEYGWDPHINRLVSTWLDPNFIGGFLAFTICILIGIALHSKNFTKKIALYLTCIILTAALFLTYSRSGYLALIAGILVLGILKSRKLIIVCLIGATIGIMALPRASQRLEDLNHSINSFIFNTSENPDPTAKLRIKSWEQTIDIIKSRPILGNGYNTLRYVNFNLGNASDPAIHSASGSDSSILTILAATGILGLIAFLYLYFKIIVNSIKIWRDQKQQSLWRGFALGILAGTGALFVHSIFVNSLLFAQILIFYWINTGILDAVERPNT